MSCAHCSEQERMGFVQAVAGYEGERAADGPLYSIAAQGGPTEDIVRFEDWHFQSTI